MDYGSSYLPSDLNAAYLYAQLELCKEINNKRMAIWNLYNEAFASLEEKHLVERPFVPDYAVHNAHMYYLKLKNLETRTAFIRYMKENGVQCVFHYIPLHTATAGQKFGRFHGEDRYTTRESERLVRLPMYYNLDLAQAEQVAELVLKFPGYQEI